MHEFHILQGLIDEASEVKRLMAQREKLQGERDWMLKRMAGTDGATVPEHIRLAEQEKVCRYLSQLICSIRNLNKKTLISMITIMSNAVVMFFCFLC